MPVETARLHQKIKWAIETYRLAHSDSSFVPPLERAQTLSEYVLDAILPMVDSTFVEGDRLVLVADIGTKPDGYWLMCADGYARRFDDHQVFVKYKWEIPGESE